MRRRGIQHCFCDKELKAYLCRPGCRYKIIPSVAMKFIFQFLIIMVFAFVGELLHHFIPLPIPASIYGILLLFLALEFKILKVKDIKETSSFLIAIMPIMFLPPAVGIVESWGLIKGSWLPYVLVIAISTVVVMAVSGLVTQMIVRKGGRK